MKFEDLQVWKRAARLCANVYTEFKGCRDFGFKDQITRSALSIASNIAEGYERDSEKDRVRFSGKTHEKPLYDGLRRALPVGANVVI